MAVDAELVIAVDVSNSMARGEAVTISRSQLSKVLRKKAAFAGAGRGPRRRAVRIPMLSIVSG
jgi:hypothetical protein